MGFDRSFFSSSRDVSSNSDSAMFERDLMDLAKSRKTASIGPSHVAHHGHGLHGSYFVAGFMEYDPHQAATVAHRVQAKTTKNKMRSNMSWFKF